MSAGSPLGRRSLLGGASQASANAGEAVAAPARIDRTCLAYRGVVCQTCGDACDARAIRFGARRGGPPWPVVLASLCTGCKDCVPVCPVDAIGVDLAPAAAAT